MSSYTSFVHGHHPLYYPYSNGNRDYSILTGSSGYSPLGFGYSHGIYFHPYPNTLSTRINWDLFADQSHLKIDPATLSIIPEYLLEPPQQLDNSHHDLNPNNGFHYHRPDEPPRSKINPASLNSGSGSLLLLNNEIFTSPMNFQYILPNGQMGELPVTWKRPNIKPISTKEANDIIYNAKKARGDTDIRDAIGNSYDPNQPQRAINDGLDFFDESVTGQIDYFYSVTDPRLINLPTRIAIDNYRQEVLLNGENFNTSYPTGLPQSQEYLRSQRYPNQYFLNTENNLPNHTTNSAINYPQPLTNVFSSSFGNQSNPVYEEPLTPYSNNSTPDNKERGILRNPVLNRIKTANPIVNKPVNMPNTYYQHLVNPAGVFIQSDAILNHELPLQNAFATNMINTKKANKSSSKSLEGTINDFTGTTYGEYQHIIEFMQKSLADITKVKVPYVGLNGLPISQTMANPALTGRIPVIDPLSHAYNWMALSPDYQRYVDYHIRDIHGGVHDVFTPRGYQPSNLFAGGMLGVGNNLQSNIPELYKSPAFITPTMTNPIADYRLLDKA